MKKTLPGTADWKWFRHGLQQPERRRAVLRAADALESNKTGSVAEQSLVDGLELLQRLKRWQQLVVQRAG